MRAGYHGRGPDSPRKNTLKKQGFYHTPAWRKARRLALQRDHYVCRLRISDRCTGVATEVHHKKELEEHPELALDLDNLVSCCWWCHEETKRKPKAPSPARGVRIIKITNEPECGLG